MSTQTELERLKVELEDYIRTKKRVIAGGNALSPGERRSLAQARKELKALTSKNQGVAEGEK